MIDWDSIKIRLDVGDTREMRPDTVGEKVDDAINYISNELQRKLYSFEHSKSPWSGIAGWI
jgi:hypothetical protein